MTDSDFDQEWITQFAATAAVDPLDGEMVDALLELAGRAAHTSGDRRNAPLAAFLAGLRLGRDGTAVTVDALTAF